MRIDIMTLFPEMFDKVLGESIIGRACNKGILEINTYQIRDYTQNKQKQVDDYPYGGGWGCVMMAQPLKSCLDDILSKAEDLKSRVIYLSPQGTPFNQTEARRLNENYDHLVLVCGHYEGIDERFIELCVDEELSLGDFVLTGGEIAAMAVTDCVCRMVPGVLSDEECFTGESHWNGLLEYPQYTRPEVWEGKKVPDILLEGDHLKIESWRHNQQLKRTRDKRPDMLESLSLNADDIKALSIPDLSLTFRNATEADIDDIMLIISQAKAFLHKKHIDQWQGVYPQADDFIYDINKGECYVALNDDEICGVFTLTSDETPGYDSITDGKWARDDIDYCTIHRIAVKDSYRGSGLSAEIIKHCEHLCREKGIKYIRVDTHKKNKSMQKLLRDTNFKYRGNVILDIEAGHDSNRQAYDKILK